MTKFYDNDSVLEISMYSLKTGEDFSQDFFEDACGRENYNENLEAYKVDDVQYLVDYATSYADGTNPDIDYPEDWEPECTVRYEVTDRPAMNEQDVESAAASLYDEGWRSADRDDLQKQEDLSDADVDAICRKLAEYEIADHKTRPIKHITVVESLFNNDLYFDKMGEEIDLEDAIHRYHEDWKRMAYSDRQRTKYVDIMLGTVPADEEDVPDDFDDCTYDGQRVVENGHWIADDPEEDD